MRLVSKLCLVKKPTSDDVVVFLAWMLAVGLSIAIMFGATVGLGKVDAQILPEMILPLWVITAGAPMLVVFPTDRQLHSAAAKVRFTPLPCCTTLPLPSLRFPSSCFT